ncbi:hypothetical protein NDU88_002176 [Pleurodeles waltl]|uniref:Uncharacterized protein n=1 Tax=Pleurodeles waltl TaxID=8319 RepID=A0AAV7UXL3_PLEWA|nr:hypothetical protein NDU88_002176 [Pleurodeles waltl]
MSTWCTAELCASLWSTIYEKGGVAKGESPLQEVIDIVKRAELTVESCCSVLKHLDAPINKYYISTPGMCVHSHVNLPQKRRAGAAWRSELHWSSRVSTVLWMEDTLQDSMEHREM